jgi:hypothetical protein
VTAHLHAALADVPPFQRQQRIVIGGAGPVVLVDSYDDDGGALSAPVVDGDDDARHASSVTDDAPLLPQAPAGRSIRPAGTVDGGAGT